MAIVGGANLSEASANLDNQPSTLHQKTITFWRKSSTHFPGGSDGHLLFQGSWDPEGTSKISNYWQLWIMGDVVNVDAHAWYIKLDVAFTGTTGIWKTNSSPGNTLDVWYHYAFTYDDNSTANNPLFYLNGVSQTINVVTTPTGVVLTELNGSGSGTNTFGFGFENITGGGGIASLDDLRIYNRILTAAEIQYIYTLRGHDADSYGKICHFKLNDAGVGTTFFAKDSTKARHDVNVSSTAYAATISQLTYAK